MSTTQKIAEHVAARDKALNAPLELDISFTGGPETSTSLDNNGSQASVYKTIVSSDVAGIVKGIETRQWTATQVLAAFIQGAKRAHKRSNCLTEGEPGHSSRSCRAVAWHWASNVSTDMCVSTIVFFKDALERAEKLDHHFATTGHLVGPLHGVPISLKEHFNIKNVATTNGFSLWLDRPIPDQDGAHAAVAKHLGAIPFVKTNLPQSGLSFECHNPLWGRTTNPYSSSHTCGGSSGGEAALIGHDGSPMGLGSDIGGSLRIPAGYCGIYSLMPTVKRWYNGGSGDMNPGFEGLIISVGPMARTAADIQLLFTAFTEGFRLTQDLSRPDQGSDGHESLGSWVQHETTQSREKLRAELNMLDVMAQPVDYGWFNPLQVIETRKKPLKVGYYLFDGFIKTSPASYRAVLEAVEALQEKYPERQVQVERVYLPDELSGFEAFKIFFALVSSDGFDTLINPNIGSDSLNVTLRVPTLSARLPWFLRPVVAFILRNVLNESHLAEGVEVAGRKSTTEYMKWVHKRNEFRKAWLEQIWKKNDLDAIIWQVVISPFLPRGPGAIVG